MGPWDRCASSNPPDPRCSTTPRPWRPPSGCSHRRLSTASRSRPGRLFQFGSSYRKGRAKKDERMIILAIDPGREKCGVVVADDKVILNRAVVPIAGLGSVLREWGRRHGVTQV